MLTKADILNAVWPDPVKVAIPAAGGRHVYVRVLSADERDALEQEIARARDDDDAVNVRGRLVALCACDEQGRRLFVDDDAAELGRRPTVLIDPIAVAAQRTNGIGTASSGAVDDAEKNSEPAPS